MTPSDQQLRGTGIAWRPVLADLLAELADQRRLGFTEVIAENTDPDSLPAAVRDLAESLPVIPHGVTLGLAGADLPDPLRLARLAGLAEQLGSPLVSEHVAFVRAADSPDPLHPEVLEAGHLMPPPRTREALDVLCQNISRAQAELPVPLAVENIAALIRWPEDEFTEGDYLTEVVERTGVRLVMDVANLFSSTTAQGTDPRDELGRFPLSAIAYVHIAGGEFRDGIYLDTHAHDMIPDVLDLLGELLSAFNGTAPGIMLERDTRLTIGGVRAEYRRLQQAVADHDVRAGR